ncbi:MAG: hypothetical protein KF722_00685 [Nitrospira sp.]|nr:hypothetical protein [Nitrospira sp.]
MKSPTYSSLGFVFMIGLMSGCSGSDNMPIITPSGPTAAVEEQRTPQSDTLTSEEAALVSQADSEPITAPKPDL